MSGGGIDHARLAERLAGLQAEMARGTARLGELEAEADRLRQTLLRIAGAIQALSELLGEHPDAAAAA